MNGSETSQTLLTQIDTATQQLRELESSLNESKLHREKDRFKRILQAARRASKQYQSNLPGLTKQQSQQWFRESADQVAAHYKAWIEALNAIVDRAKGRP